MKNYFVRPKEDFCMKELFRNERIRRQFLSDTLGIPIEGIKNTRLANSFLGKSRRDQKEGILDVLIELNDDTRVNVELQLRTFKHWDRRQIFYVAKVYVSGFRKGQDYDRIKNTVGISLLDFNLTDREEYHSVYRLRDEKGHELSGSMEIHIIELKKRPSGRDPVDEWIRFFNIGSREELEQMKTKNPGILEAIRELKEMNLTQRIRMEMDARMIARADERAREAYVREEGEERFVELSRKLLKEGRSEDLLRATEDRTYRDTLYTEYKL